MTTEPAETTEPESSVIAELRSQTKAKDELIAQLEARVNGMEKRSIFGELGIDTSSGMGQFVYEKYDGEVTQEAVKAFAENMGLLADQTQTETTPPGEAEVLQDMGNTQSATPPQPPASLEQQLANANTPEEIEALMRQADLVS